MRIFCKYLLLTFFIFLFPYISLANDSAACIGMGGLVFQKNDQIKMVSEDLRISPSRVQVEYLYRNESDKDIELLVAFPIPSVDFVYSMMAIPRLNWWNFKTLVNGQEIEWFPLDPNEKDGGKGYYPENFQRFITESQIEKFNPYIEDGSGCYGSKYPTEKYYSILRVQKFPANETVKVYHEYSPAYGSGIPYYDVYQMKDAILGINRSKDEKKMDKSWFKCIHKRDSLVEIDKMIKDLEETPVEDRPFMGELVWYRTIGYILKTGNNWNGPIKKFRLEITGPPPFILQTCFKGLKRVSESTYLFEAENYEPKENLNLTFYY